MKEEIKETNSIIVGVQCYEERNSLVVILANNGYEVTVKTTTDIIAGIKYFIIANKVV
jgi:hypothetical protein